MSPHSAYDFSIDKTQSYACIELLDRNENMASYGLSVAVDLEHGTVDARVSLDIEGHCAAKPRENGSPCDVRSIGEPWVENPPASPAAEMESAWGFDVDETQGWVTHGGALHASLCADEAPRLGDRLCAEVESRSPSGRWILLSGRWDDSDYIYREIILFDRETGELWRLFEEREGAVMFRSVVPQELFETSKPSPHQLSLIGESDFAWLPGDRLWIDGRLLIPERREHIALGGRLARALGPRDQDQFSLRLGSPENQ